MKDHIYVWVSDSGHAWLQVPVEHLRKLGLSLGNFSTYSYKDSACENAYLEEDCDADIFWKAYESHFGHKPATREENYNGECFVRSLRAIREERSPVVRKNAFAHLFK